MLYGGVGVEEQRGQRRHRARRACARARARSRSRRRRCRSSGAIVRRWPARPAARAADRATCRARTRPSARVTAWTRVPVSSVTPASADAGQQRVQHVARLVGVGKELAARLFVQRQAEIAEERDGLLDRERAQHAADDRPLAAPEVGLGDDGVRDVAAAAAADEDLGARLEGAVEQDDRPRRRGAAREDRGREAGGAGADDRDVTGGRQCCHQFCNPRAPHAAACGRPS